MFRVLLSYISFSLFFICLLLPLNEVQAGSSGDHKGTWNQYPYHSPSEPYQLHQDFQIPDSEQK